MPSTHARITSAMVTVADVPARLDLGGSVVMDRAVGQPMDLLVGGCGSRERGHDHDDDAQQEEHAGGVEEVEVADGGQEGGIVNLASPAPKKVWSVSLIMPRTKPPPRPQVAPAAVDPLPEQAEEEDGRDRRRQVALHALQVLVEATALRPWP